ncbi:TetR family transcriptional regulator [Streptomyces fodineus]|uniref:TetR family transcriptional regulator n=1 Tax=Streptomyces fodineus TaxID=1904616 RepID=A0A1D7Y585_9ACTN|nr:TetR/AcrR family transcriptional regulator [Streptomyces fodineus]AOR30706.1 TetR family transcriptional regulator [Streptomyces fodineus]
MARLSAEERRERVISAAITEFAQRGYYGTPTETIARRVGVSQPYLFRLFPDKMTLFVAASLRSLEDTRTILAEAAEGLLGEEALHAMANAYSRMLTEHPEKLQMHMQTYITVTAVQAAGDHGFGDAVRAGWMKLWETVHLPLGADVNATTAFLAYGMLVNTLTAMGFPPEHHVWQGVHPSAKPARLP